MTRIVARVIAASSLALAAGLALAAPVAPLRPLGKWTVDYAENMCVLQRSYGTAAAPVYLAFKPAPFADSVRLIVLTGTRDGRVRSGTATVGFGAAPPARGPYISAFIPATGKQVLAVDLKRSELPMAATGLLTVQAGKSAEWALQVEAPAAAFRALNACVGNLLASWGMDPAAQAAIARPPAPTRPIHTAFSSNDFPREAVRLGVQGTSGVRFAVGADGIARECVPVEPSGSAVLDATTCRILMSRVRFDPARGHDGTKLPSLSYTRVRWVLPDY